MSFPPRPPRGAFNPRFRKEQQQEHRTNNMIRVPEVRLVGENLEPGIFPIADALKIAQDLGLDLVEISPVPFRPFAGSSITTNFCTMKRRRRRR